MRLGTLKRLGFLLLLGLGANLGSPLAQGFGTLSPGAGITPADSLPSFRPDSMDFEKIRQLENGRSSQDTGKGKSDTAAQARKIRLFFDRPPYFALHAGIGFLDLQGRENFVRALEATRLAEGDRILQPYESVTLNFPAGLLLGFRIAPYADLVLKTHSFWSTQSALLGDSLSGAGTEEYYAIQGHLGGLGIRLYVPQEILSVKNHGLIYLEAIRFWDLAAVEIYSNHGAAKAQWEPQGSAFELQFGFMHNLQSKLTWSAALSFIHSGWSSDRSWSDILPLNDTNSVHWGGNALQMRFFLFWNPMLNLPPP